MSRRLAMKNVRTALFATAVSLLVFAGAFFSALVY